jgi:hypothetical protein
MIELAFLAMLNRLMNWGLTPIIVTRIVAADGHALRAFLASPANQWRLATSFCDVVAVQPAGKCGDARLRLPFGARMNAGIHVKASQSARVLSAELSLGRRTVAWATWILTPDRGTTEIDLAVQFESRGLATRLVLLLGGRRWIARRLDMVLATLATASARVAESFVSLPPADVSPAPTTAGRQDAPVQATNAAIAG